MIPATLPPITTARLAMNGPSGTIGGSGRREDEEAVEDGRGAGLSPFVRVRGRVGRIRRGERSSSSSRIATYAPSATSAAAITSARSSSPGPSLSVSLDI